MSKLHKRAKQAARLLRFAPFLRLAGLNGSIMRGEEGAKSDIDFLIIAKSGRLYTCRFFATLLIALTGKRRHGSKIAGRICLNCYLNDRGPNIFPEYKKSIPKVVRAYKYMIPLVDEGVSRKFFRSNRWFDGHAVSGEEHSKVLKALVFYKFPIQPRAKTLEKLLSGKFGEIVEHKLMAYQQSRILKGKQKGDEIFCDRFAIKLHPKKH